MIFDSQCLCYCYQPVFVSHKKELVNTLNKISIFAFSFEFFDLWCFFYEHVKVQKFKVQGLFKGQI